MATRSRPIEEGQQYKLTPGASMTMFAELVAALHRGSWSQDDLRRITGCSQATIVRFIRAFRHRSRRFIYIASWKRTAEVGGWTAQYSWGQTTDEPKPKPKSNSEYCRAYRLRKKRRANVITYTAAQLSAERACKTIGD